MVPEKKVHKTVVRACVCLHISDQAGSVMIVVQALTPKHPSFSDFEKVKGFATLYNGNIEDISHKLYQLQRLLQCSAQNTLSSLLEFLCLLEQY